MFRTSSPAHNINPAEPWGYPIPSHGSSSGTPSPTARSITASRNVQQTSVSPAGSADSPAPRHARAASATVGRTAPPAAAQPLHSSSPNTSGKSSPAHPGVTSQHHQSDSSLTPQQALWSSLKLDPLLIQHATGLHRVLQDVQALQLQFTQFASHLLHMSKVGASLTSHLQALYKSESCPEGVRLMASSHSSMAQQAVQWFSHKFKNELLNLFADWQEDAEAVLSQLGLVQKTRHELDGLQDEVEKLFEKRNSSPFWDAHAETSLQRRLENSKEKLAAAAMLYDGQRRGVEKSMRFLLDQRAQLFHQVSCCFMEYEYRFFRDFSAHAAAFVASYPYSPLPPNVDFAEEPFSSSARSDVDVVPTEHSASALLLTLPYFQWKSPMQDGSGGTGEVQEGPSVRAIRRSMAAKAQRDAKATVAGQTSSPAAASAHSEQQTPTTPSASATRTTGDDAPGAWEAQAASWEKKQSESTSSPTAAPHSPQAPLHLPKMSLPSSPASTAAQSVSEPPVLSPVAEAEEPQTSSEPVASPAAPTATEDEATSAASAAVSSLVEAVATEIQRRHSKSESKEQSEEAANDTDHSAESVLPPPDLSMAVASPVSTAAAAAHAAGAVSGGGLAPQRSPSSSDESGTHTSDHFVSPQPLHGTSSPPTDATPAADDDDDEDTRPSRPSDADVAADAAAAAAASAADAAAAAAAAASPTPQQASTMDAELMSAMMSQMEEQAAAAAALNLPAKLLPRLLPATRLHPAIWEPVSLARIKGSIWGKILVEHLQFDPDSDEMREKFSLLAPQVPVLEGAFATNIPWEEYEEAWRQEREWQEADKAQAMQAAHGSIPAGTTIVPTSLTPTTQRRTSLSASHTPGQQHDRFASLRTLDGTYSAPPSALTTPFAPFPAAPFPHFTAKQWFVAHQVLTGVLFPYSPEAIVEALYKCDDRVLTPARVAGLVKIFPNEQQRLAIQTTPRTHQLTQLERLLMLLSLPVRPSLHMRLTTLAFQVELGPVCYHLEETLDALARCVLEIKRSHNLRIIFAILLHLGNFLNLSHHKSLAYGFHVDFLSQLRKIRMTSAAHANSTLLDFLVYYLATNYPSLNFAAFSDKSFPHLAPALKIDEWMLVMEMRYLGEQFALIKQMNEEDEYEKQNRSVTTVAAVAPPSVPMVAPPSASAPPPTVAPSTVTLPCPVSGFPPRVARFLSHAHSRLTVLRHKYVKVKADILDVCKYLCVLPTEVVDPVADAAAHLRAPLDPRSDAGFAFLPPLGEVLTSATSPSSITSTTAGSSSSTRTHTRFDWHGALHTLHKFLQEFSLAQQDYAVSIRVARKQAQPSA